MRKDKGEIIMKPNNLVLYNVKNGIARITLNRLDVLNTLNKEMLIQLSSALDMSKRDDSVKGVIITGAGEKSFSSGADISVPQKAA